MNEHLPGEGVGLQRFLAAVAALRAGVPFRRDVYESLANYFAAAHPLLQKEPLFETKPQPVPVPDLARVVSVVQALKEALTGAAARGDFLEVWQVAGLKRNELRNASVLAWLLNPRESHGRGDAILRALLDRAATSVPGWPLVPDDLLLTQVRTEQRPLGSERDRVDIAVDGPDFALFVEVKIDALEGADQLVRYAESAREKARAMGKPHALVIYLAPRRPRASPPAVACLTWQDVAAAASANLPEGLAGRIVGQFAHHVRSFA